MSIGKHVLDILFPPKCVFCHGILEDGEENVCEKCAGSVRISSGPYTAPNLSDSIDFAYAPFTYEGDVRESLLRFKFGGNTFYADTYAEAIFCSCPADRLQCDIITWVPLARKRLRKRGYDQAGLIAQRLSEKMGVTCIRTLKKKTNIRPQSSVKSSADRMNNVKGVYEAINPEFIEGKRILLVDDILTTGATVSECARTLYAAGARSVSVAAAAHR